MSRSYRNIRPSDTKVYSVAEVQTLFRVSRNTVSNWVGAGLVPSDKALPQLFRGAELKRFHTERTERTRHHLRPGEFKCIACGSAVFPELGTLSLQCRDNQVTLARATCCDCGAALHKLLGAMECDKVQECLDTNMPLARIDEGKATPPAGIGKDKGVRGVEWFTTNDRIVYEWQAFAGKYSPKTVQAHLVSIRDFETFLNGVHFNKIKPKHAGKYRDYLVCLLTRSKEQGGLSSSTVRHRASHLKAFFEWLRGQEGYRRLSSSIPDYFALPRSASTAQSKERLKVYPTLDEAWRMIELMPEKSVIQRRDRAMVALAFISGFRAAALSALRIKHIDFDSCSVVQDARDVPAKNGKTYRAKWFPRTEAFQEVFLSWVKELQDFGFEPQDALFPDGKKLAAQTPRATPVEPLASSKPLQDAFAKASGRSGKIYTPHSARHTLKALGAQMCRSHEQRKAWSMNLGHSDEQITEKHYAKMSQSRSAELMETLCSDLVFTEEENEMIIDYYQHRFLRGTPEYYAAKSLAEKRDKAQGDSDVLD
ncbi:tyrosine-type recombinase/integrase [Sulfitobacter sp. W027]|uniref:tyrosine-type recombinase/integrase n=1 Tax=Sulfitobacter sp. W027 TaxID=2867025 RepID=UPI0021A7F5B5|nr:tyrosine-type recombinase/integrase [Sulfitobacter sp. W027]UWR32322.1 tyrosine-type recombinase/integrase [Sulfitobacter sp. W027]